MLLVGCIHGCYQAQRYTWQPVCFQLSSMVSRHCLLCFVAKHFKKELGSSSCCCPATVSITHGYAAWCHTFHACIRLPACLVLWEALVSWHPLARVTARTAVRRCTTYARTVRAGAESAYAKLVPLYGEARPQSSSRMRKDPC
jgi:hypothetical protein